MKSFPILLSVSGDADGVVLRGACKLFRLPSLRRLSPHDNFLFQCIFSRTLGVCVSELWIKQRVTVERVSGGHVFVLTSDQIYNFGFNGFTQNSVPTLEGQGDPR